MKFRSVLALILCLALIAACLTGCGGKDSPTIIPGGTTEAAPSTQNTTPAAESNGLIEEMQRQQMYDYVSTVLVPEKGLADLGPFTWTHAHKANDGYDNWEMLQNGGCYGLVSAVVRDFDFDGNQELVAFYLTAMPTAQTWEPIYGGNSYLESYVVSMELYTLQDGQVVLSDSYHCLNQLDDESWGYICVYLEQLEDGIYIDAFSSAEDYTTYGASPRTIFHVANDKFVFDYISGIGYGQGSIDENPNNLMGTTNINPSEYTFDARYEDDSTVRNVMMLDFDNQAPNDGTMVYTGTDYTQLRTILTEGVDAVEIQPLPQGGRKPEDPAITATKDTAQAIADYVAAESGCVFVDCTNSVYSDTASYRYETEEYSFLVLRLNSETGALVGVSVSNNGYPVPDEWFSMKDAVIDYPSLGLDRAELDFLYGTDVSMNKYTNGVEITGAKVAIRQITSTDFVLEFITEE